MGTADIYIHSNNDTIFGFTNVVGGNSTDEIELYTNVIRNNGGTWEYYDRKKLDISGNTVNIKYSVPFTDFNSQYSFSISGITNVDENGKNVNVNCTISINPTTSY